MLQRFGPQPMMSGPLPKPVEPVMFTFHRFALLITALVLVGCGSKNPARVRGSVTLDNKPLTSGTVTFHPVGGKGAVAYGQIDSAGNYELTTGASEGLAPGSYIATVVAMELAAPIDPTVEPEMRPITPAKYAATATSDLKLEVKAGANSLPLVMKSR
jgi:hypothetical protein